MNTIIKIAWRNCWRNPLRTSIVILSIALGIWSSIFLMGFSTGLVNQRVDKMIHLEIGDIQIHSSTYDVDGDITNSIENTEKLLQSLKNNEDIHSFSSRFKTEAYAVSPHGQMGVKLLGVDAIAEQQVLNLETRLLEGTFLESDNTYPILVGKKLAEELHLRMNSKIQLNFTDPYTMQVSKNFKVCGIFSAGNEAFDGTTVFVPKETIQRIIGSVPIHEIIIKTKNETLADQLAENIQQKYPENLIESWKTRYPEIAYGVEMMDSTMYILMSIIIAALLFGIINTLTMSILERKKELGILMAVGMKKWNIRLMIVFEYLVYGIVGGPIGILLGYLTMQYFGNKGFDLSGFGEGLESFGYDPMVYFEIAPKYYIIYTLYILFATFIGGFYPSRIATKLNPIEAIRSI